MSVDLRMIESFVLVVREGSLARAEAVCGIPKATLSRQVARLESELGTQLLNRVPRGVTATEAGRMFYAHSAALLTEVSGRIEAARTLVHNLSEGVSGSLSVLSDNHLATTFTCHVVRQFLGTHPNLRCEVYVAETPGAPSSDEVDCYICSVPPDRPDTIGRLLGTLGVGVYASPAYLVRETAPEAPEDLTRHRAIILEGEDEDAVELRSGQVVRPYTPTAALLTNDYWIMKTFCIDGIGIALMPDFFVRPEVIRGGLVPVLPAWRGAPRRVHCAYRRQRYVGRKLRAFVDLMVRSIADIDSFNFYVGSPAKDGNGSDV